MQTPIRKILVVGGGVDGWMSAAILSRILSARNYEIELLDLGASEGGVGAFDGGVASLPDLRILLDAVGLPEAALFAKADAVVSLGCEFAHWSRGGGRYFQPFGPFGAPIDGVSFHHYWQRMRQARDIGDLTDYSLAAIAAKLGKFAPPVSDPRSVLSTYSYAYHCDGAALARLLRDLAERRGVRGVAGEIASVDLNGETGFIESVTLKGGERLHADLYLDCTGADGVLIEQALRAGFEDWRHWLPCDRVIVLQSESAAAPAPYRTATAVESGWMWRMPLRRTADHGFVYASAFLDDAKAETVLLKRAEGAVTAAPRRGSLASGRRKTAWSKNCVAIGASACVLDPLAPTALQLTQKGALTLLRLLPDKSFSGPEADEYNRIMAATAERMRDFLVLHYKAAPRTDSPFWLACAEMQAPDSLVRKMDLFESKGRVLLLDDETFLEPDWAAAYFGHGVFPRCHDPLADTADSEQIGARLRTMRAAIRAAAEKMPSHAAFLAQPSNTSNERPPS